ncbi:TIGR01777 family oxidoreductase [Halodesulfovibrio aestuarii]|uniref:TIGR01777 family oxidoreductase n=1 Tax=Halodesulfovibrio aestuarii TaxID=126333 RepID=UPI0035210B8B
MRAVLLGGSGFIGRALTSRLLENDVHVVVTSRNPQHGRYLIPEGHSFHVDFALWDGKDPEQLSTHIKSADAVINLIGSNIAAGRWTEERKEEIRNSRISAGNALCSAISMLEDRPKVVIQSSAIGFYGAHPTSPDNSYVTEDSSAGQGFLASVCKEWEDSTACMDTSGTRRVIIRSGLVLGNGGVLHKFLPPFKFGVGGPLGNGKQVMSWIHIQDQVDAIIHIIKTSSCTGVFNLTSPNPETMDTFCRTLGSVLGKPSWLRVPAPLLRIALGEMAEELILQGQRVLPEKLLESGFCFSYPSLDDALANILRP